ncbi:MAG: MoxR family ATPase [Pseudomonadota bacterium]
MSEGVKKEEVYALMDRIKAFGKQCDDIKREISKVIVGHEEVIEGVLIALLSGGHVLLEGVPGIGKTLLVKTFSQALDLSFSRIQFTPDLMPADVTGTMILIDREGKRDFEFSQGPIFANLVLADEINRATPKTQSALLEAMQEKKVTVLGKTRPIDQPFVVLATQNPIEMEGTYPLPEAQLDRFLIKILLRFPPADELETVLERTTIGKEPEPSKVISKDDLLDMSRLVRDMQIENKSVIKYVARLIKATHPDDPNATDMVKKYVRYGASPRGAQALILCGKVRTLIKSRPAIDFEDIRSVAVTSLRHRIILNFEGESSNISTDAIIREVVEKVPDVDF